MRLYSNVSKVSFSMSSARSDVTGRPISPASSTLYSPTQMDLQGYDTFSYHGGEDFAGSHPNFHRDSINGIASHSTHGSVTTDTKLGIFVSTDELAYASPMDGTSRSLAGKAALSSRATVTYSSNGNTDSPIIWHPGTHILGSQTSSPTIFDQNWTLSQETTSTNSPADCSPSLDGLSPGFDLLDPLDIEEASIASYHAPLPSPGDLSGGLLPYPAKGERTVRKPVRPRPSKVTGDMAAANRRHHPGSSATSDESFKLAGRPSSDGDNTARDHPLYHNIAAHPDGLYHCPWEGKQSCTHKPEKLKCNYEYDPFYFSIH